MSIINALFPHTCGDTNHKFKPRYSYGAPVLSFDIDMISDEDLIEDIITASKPVTYHGDVCIYCGMTVERKYELTEVDILK